MTAMFYKPMAQNKAKIHFDEIDFDKDVIKSELPVLVVVSAPWCGPCRRISPLVDSVKNSISNRVNVFKINIDDYEKEASEYNVRQVPTFMMFQNGQLLAQKVDANMTEDKIKMFISDSLPLVNNQTMAI